MIDMAGFNALEGGRGFSSFSPFTIFSWRHALPKSELSIRKSTFNSIKALSSPFSFRVAFIYLFFSIQSIHLCSFVLWVMDNKFHMTQSTINKDYKILFLISIPKISSVFKIMISINQQNINKQNINCSPYLFEKRSWV